MNKENISSPVSNTLYLSGAAKLMIKVKEFLSKYFHLYIARIARHKNLARNEVFEENRKLI